MTNPTLSPSAASAMSTHIATRAIQTLIGIVTGIVADANLHDSEISLLSSWLDTHPEATISWPGSAIADVVRTICDDGVITDDERDHLLQILTSMVASDFSVATLVDDHSSQVPVDDSSPLVFPGQGIVHTGNFIFGTRARCERLSESLGAILLDTVTRKTDLLVVGTRVTATWATESYGRKIMRAMDLKRAGHPIRIVSERHWLANAMPRSPV